MFTCSLNLKALLDNCAHIALSNAEGDGMWLRSFFDALLFFSDFFLRFSSRIDRHELQPLAFVREIILARKDVYSHTSSQDENAQV